MADDLERPGERLDAHEEEPHLPAPTVWPIAFAAGIALVLVGLIVSWPVAAVGAVLSIVFGFLWIREATREVRGEPAPAAVALRRDDEEEVVDEEEEDETRMPRAKFLEGATLGLGALIGGVVTLPALGFAVAPAFVGQDYKEVDLGPLENFPTGQFLVATFYSRSDEGDVGRRTAFVRNNGMVDDVPSFTIISNRCTHLGCPVQPQGPMDEENATQVESEAGEINLIPTQPSGFGCPCHGGAYDDEGNRLQGPPVRALDRYQYAIRQNRLVLREPYSVGSVSGQGADAKIEAYRLADPGQHVDGPEEWFYPPKVWLR